MRACRRGGGNHRLGHRRADRGVDGLAERRREVRNLYDETVAFLADHNKSFDDVVFVSGNGHEIELNNFIKISREYDYYEGYGGNEVPMDLMIVGEDWWIERHEYDGSEWWEYKALPVRPPTVKEVKGFGEWDRYVYEEGGAE